MDWFALTLGLLLLSVGVCGGQPIWGLAAGLGGFLCGMAFHRGNSRDKRRSVIYDEDLLMEDYF